MIFLVGESSRARTISKRHWLMKTTPFLEPRSRGSELARRTRHCFLLSLKRSVVSLGDNPLCKAKDQLQTSPKPQDLKPSILSCRRAAI